MSSPISILLTDTTRWPGGARLAVALSRAGCAVSCLCPARGHPVAKLRALRESFVYSALRPLASLAAAIRAVDPVIVIPCDERAVQHLHELHARARRQGPSARGIADTIERSLGSPESYPIVCDRYALIQIAREEGIRVAATHPLRTVEDLAQWQAGTHPCVLKADGTNGGYGIRIAYNSDDVRKYFRVLSQLLGTPRVFKRSIVNRDPFWLRHWWRRSRPTLIAQSYIDGQPANCAVVCREGRVLAGTAVQVVCASSPTEPATVVRVVDHAEMMLAAERIARRLHLSGFFGLDFIMEAGTGDPYLIEMNPRITPQCHLRLGGRRDMVGALLQEFSDQSCEMPPVTENDMIAYFPQAWSVKNEFFQSSFQDIPSEEPELVQELLNPWLERTFLVRMFNLIYRQRGQSRQSSIEPITPGAASVSSSK